MTVSKDNPAVLVHGSYMPVNKGEDAQTQFFCPDCKTTQHKGGIFTGRTRCSNCKTPLDVILSVGSDEVEIRSKS
jgi:hypothetical protein